MHEELWILPFLEHSIEQSVMLLNKQAHFHLTHQLSFGMYTRNLKRIYSFSLWHERAIAKHMTHTMKFLLLLELDWCLQIAALSIALAGWRLGMFLMYSAADNDILITQIVLA